MLLVSMASVIAFLVTITLAYISYLRIIPQRNTLLFSILSIIFLVSTIFSGCSSVLKNRRKINIQDKKTKFKIAFSSALLTVAYVVFIGLSRYYRCYGLIDGEQIFYHMFVSSSGMDFSTVFTIAIPSICGGVIFAVCLSYFLYLSLYFIDYCRSNNKRMLRRHGLLMFNLTPLVAFILVFLYLFHTIPITQFIYYQYFTSSSFIEDHYADPKDTTISFPDEKRNLIYIYMESMENTFADKKNGGAFDENMIPEITKLQNENIFFSNNDNHGGALTTYGMTYTTASIVSQSFGIPLKVGNKSFPEMPDAILPNMYNIFDILDDAGYAQYVIMGSSADFGGLKELFDSHGNTTVFDYNSMIDEEFIDKNYRVFWGVEDKLMYDYSKKKLDEISKKDEPFFFVMETVDTHNPDGWCCNECGDKFDSQYGNVVACASKQVNDFVSWAQKQSWYENTTIVIVGDHLSMKNDFFEDINKNYNRTTLNIFINSTVDNIASQNFVNRQFCSMDMLPTTLAAIGCKIDGDRLGLGTNLFSQRQTIFEEFGFEFVNTEFKKKSTFTQSVFE